MLRLTGRIEKPNAKPASSCPGDGSSVRPAARGEDPGEMGAAQSLLL